ncbi:MAG: transcriptional regulator [Candidatus Bathyarchaeia archaeon]
MLIPCEVAVKTVSPAIRALLAKTLIEKHDMKEIQVAQILGITQSAVSKYFKNARGTAIPLENVADLQPITDKMIALLLTNPAPQPEIMALFCQACILIRSTGLMCPICRENQKSKLDNCDFCQKDGSNIY